MSDAPDEQAFVALYERHYGAVLGYARRRVPEPIARDVAADTFLVAWRRLDLLHPLPGRPIHPPPTLVIKESGTRTCPGFLDHREGWR